MESLEVCRSIWIVIVIVVDVFILARVITDYETGYDLIDGIIAFVLVAQFVGFTYYCWF